MTRTPHRGVEVLLSTYNGERYLGPLLDSLWQQTYQDFKVRVRDDGSSDATADVLRRAADLTTRISITFGPNLGPANSFLELIRSVDPSTQFAALCDQDDVWLPHKLASGVSALTTQEEPALYCGRVLVTDAGLNPLRVHPEARRGPSFTNALVENIAAGATIMLNRVAIDLVARGRPDHLLMHDAWLYLLISGCGVVIFDPEPQVLYRQHTANAIGVVSGLVDWRRRMRRQWKEGSRRVLTAQAADLRRWHYNDLRPQERLYLDDFLASSDRLVTRLRYAATGASYRQRREDDLLYRALYAIRRI